MKEGLKVTMEMAWFYNSHFHISCCDYGTSDRLVLKETQLCKGIGWPQLPHHNLLGAFLLQACMWLGKMTHTYAYVRKSLHTHQPITRILFCVPFI